MGNVYLKSQIPPHLLECFEPAEIGLEKTPAEFVAAMVEVFGLVRELLADDGVLWLNLGDSYAAQRGGTAMPAETLAGGVGGAGDADAHRGHGSVHAHRNASKIGLKHKDLIGIPWRVAFALQDAGWYLRQDIIWHKPNPMPESVTDRCTKAHEYLFLLAKSERYFWDAQAMKEQAVGQNLHDLTGPGYVAPGQAPNTGNRKELRSDIESRHRSQIKGGQSMQAEPDGMRNRRSVWTVPTVPYSGAHFATFPPALIEPCILAGSRTGDVVLDPFFGSGTTGQVAQALGRQWVGCELNPEYAPLQRARTAQAALAI